MAKGTQFEKFDSRTGDIESYLERIEMHFVSLDIASTEETAAKRRAILLSSLGNEAYRVLKDVSFPNNPTERGYQQLTEDLKKHFKPKRITVAERFRFNTAQQLPGQSILEYVAHLKKLATYCEFTGDHLQQSLRDRFICGLRSEAIQKKLLSNTYNFQQAVDIALAEEAAANDVKDISGQSGAPLHYTKQKGHRSGKADRGEKRPTKQKCERCGLSSHSKEDCWHKASQCFSCGKKGHLKSQCRAPPKSSQGRTGKKLHCVEDQDNHYVEDQDRQDENDFDRAIFAVVDTPSPVQRAPTIKIPVILEDKEIEMELDTGAAVSVVSYADYCKYFKHLPLAVAKRKLHAYTGTPLKVMGEIMTKVRYNKQECKLPMVVVKADTHAPLLFGRSWLQAIQLDWPAIFSQGQYSVQADVVDELKTKYADIFKQELGTVKGIKAALHIKENVRPIFCRSRQVPFALRPAVERELARMQSEGIIVPVDFSEWATPLVCVPKPDGTVRLCGDYRTTVNKSINTDQFPIPTAEEIRSKLSGGERFSKIDLKCAYQQMLLDEKSQELCTINTHKGLFRYTRLPFGISSSPAIWQRFMEQVLSGMDSICVMLDDVLVTGKTNDEHLRNLEEVFVRFQRYGLRLKEDKCAFLQPSVTYYGLKISKQGVRLTEQRIKALCNAPQPHNVAELRSFLGLVAALSSFIPNLSELTHPLNELLGNKPWKWSKACERSFFNLKEVVTSDTVLIHYDPAKKLDLAVDASQYGLGAVIMHTCPDGKRRPIAYASRSLNKHEKGYSQIDKEALAIMFGLKRFRSYLYGRHFTIWTDHKPLQRIFGPKHAIPVLAAHRLQRWALILAAFDYDIQFVTSRQNAVADALSRLPLTNVDMGEEDTFRIEQKLLESLPITHKEIRHATSVDPVLTKVQEFLTRGWPKSVDDDVRLKPYFDRKFELTLEQGCILWGLRVVVPQRYQKELLEELHRGHPGIVRMKEVSRSYIWWPKINEAIEQTVRSCTDCQQVRNPPAVAPLTPWMWPTIPWTRVHVDYAEQGKRNFLIVVDAHSRWPEVFAMQSTTSEATIVVLRDLFTKYGIPVQLVSDNGPQFRSAEFEYFLKANGVKHVKVSPYHAASNGLAERMVQSFKRSCYASRKSNMTLQQCISNFLLTYRTTTHPTTGHTPAKLFLGRELRTRLSLVKPDVQTNVLQAQSNQKNCHDIHSKYREFYPGDAVYIKDLRQVKTWWAGTVVERSGPKSYLTVLQDGRVWKRHVDHLTRRQLSPLQNVPENNETTNEAIEVPVTAASKNATPPPPLQNHDQLTSTDNEQFTSDHIEGSSNFPNVPESDESNTAQGTEQSNETVTNETVSVQESVPPTACRRSSRIGKPPDRLIETMS